MERLISFYVHFTCGIERERESNRNGIMVKRDTGLLTVSQIDCRIK